LKIVKLNILKQVISLQAEIVVICDFGLITSRRAKACWNLHRFCAMVWARNADTGCSGLLKQNLAQAGGSSADHHSQ
jgi:hypothetical protein